MGEDCNSSGLPHRFAHRPVKVGRRQLIDRPIVAKRGSEMSWPVLILVLLLLLLAVALYKMNPPKPTEVIDEGEPKNQVGTYPNRYYW